MFYNELSSTYDVIIDDVTPSLSGSRFAVSTIVSNLGNPPSPHTPPLVTSTTRWTINDEHAPTVFTTTELLWKQTNQSQASSYWQWRTVCYTSVDRNHKHSSDVKISMLVSTNTAQKKEMLLNPILRSYLRMDVLGGSSYWTSRVVFGSVGDGGYNATRYLYWVRHTT
uniref:Uncharacterized protein n=1 Tax=Ciona savignyi TaxID=51511 RepID=H2YN21_CIOSA